ncbi:MAG: OmpH family outer membrane protein [Haliscomenobacter sp.]
MKNNLSLILNAILFVAVGYLLVAKFQSGKTSQEPAAAESASSSNADVVYVRIDSLLDKYDVYQDKVKALEQKSKDAEAALQARGRTLEREFLQAQQKVQQGLLTPNQVQQEEQRLTQKQQVLVAEQEKMSRQLLDERQVILDELEKNIKDILKEIRQEKGYAYILNYGPGTGVLMVDEKLDITSLVLERIKADSSEEKK